MFNIDYLYSSNKEGAAMHSFFFTNLVIYFKDLTSTGLINEIVKKHTFHYLHTFNDTHVVKCVLLAEQANKPFILKEVTSPLLI